MDALILTVGGRLRRSRRWWKNSAIFVYRMPLLKVWCSASLSIFWTSLLTDCKKLGLMCVTRFINYLIIRRLTLRTPGLPFGRNDVTPSSRCHYQTLQYGLLPSFADFSADSPSPVNNIDVTVFLVSLKAGGVALNLTEASRVYLMDSWWNPAVSTVLALHASYFDKRFQLQVEYRMLCFIEG